MGRPKPWWAGSAVAGLACLLGLLCAQSAPAAGHAPKPIAEEATIYRLAGPVNAVDITTGRGHVSIDVGATTKLEVRLTKLVKANLSVEDRQRAGRVQLVPKLVAGKLTLNTQGPEGPGGWGDIVDYHVAIRAPITWTAGRYKNQPKELPHVRIQTNTGGVGVGKLRCALRVDTVSGEVNLDALDGEAAIGTVEGNITGLRLFWKQATIASSAGRIELALGRVARGDTVQLSSSTGDITVLLPRDASCRVEADTTAGKTTTEIPELRSGIRYSGRSLRGVLGKGGGLVKLQSTTGKLKVKWL